MMQKGKMEQVARHIVFSGEVQGVGFRFTALNVATRCCLVGYVRNLANGMVEMLAQGSAEDIDDCIRDIQKSFADYIRETQVKEIPFDPKYKDFKITF
jgi:acylphosphatase